MTFVPNFPPSLMRKISEDDPNDGKKKSKEDFKKMKEVEEARKLAVMPAMKDEEGHDINPHIPQYIMQAPWYYGSIHPTLRHQRIQDDEKREDTLGKMKGSVALSQWYKRGFSEDNLRAMKYRDGACENCGSMTYKKKECLERPRKLGAKYTGLDIAPDDYKQIDLKLGYDAKRDRWNGYNPCEHQRLVAEFQRLDEARKLVKAKKLEEKLAAATSLDKNQELAEPAASAAAPTLDDDADLDEDDDRYGDELDMPGQKFDSKQRQSIRNLRIREDTAKYLFNLDPNSAYYDPKTRAMRENPFDHTGKSACEVPFAGDNFIRLDGDAPKMLESQVFAWEMHGKYGLDIHQQADPTRLEFLAKKVSAAKEKLQSNVRDQVLDRYGGREHLEAPPQELLLGQWESYVEYTPTGRILKGNEKPTVKSRYEEDILVNNHKFIWGSYWFCGQWGYKCCHSLVKSSYCTGSKGKSLALPEAPAQTATSSLIAPLCVPGDDDLSEDDSSSSSSQSNSHSNAGHLSVQDADVPDRQSRKDSDVSECYRRSVSESSNSMGAGEKAENKGFLTERETVRREQMRSRRAKKRRKHRENRKRAKKPRTNEHRSSISESASASSSNSEDEETIRELRIQMAVTKEKNRITEVNRLLAIDERKRPYNSLAETKVPTEEEMEAYYRTRLNTSDPMSSFLQS